MARSVIKTATSPVEVKTKSSDSVWVCRCGLTSNPDGTCSGNHRKFKVSEEEPGEMYAYDEKGQRRKVAVIDLDEDDDVGCSGSCAACAGCGGVGDED